MEDLGRNNPPSLSRRQSPASCMRVDSLSLCLHQHVAMPSFVVLFCFVFFVCVDGCGF